MDLTEFGINAISTALVESFRQRKKLDVAGPILTSAGLFSNAHAFNPMWEFTANGRGDFPSAIALGADATLSIAGISGGITLILDTRYGERMDDYQTWEFSGENAPSATTPA